jgi:hypothetical protein
MNPIVRYLRDELTLDEKVTLVGLSLVVGGALAVYGVSMAWNAAFPGQAAGSQDTALSTPLEEDPNPATDGMQSYPASLTPREIY